MKKILSILICVVLGVGGMFSATKTHSFAVKGYAIGEGISEQGNQFGGGTIKMMGRSATGENSNSNTYTSNGPGTTATINVNEKEKTWELFSWSTWQQKAKLKLEATADPNYIFEGFTQENNLAPSSWVSQTTPYGDFDIPWQGQNNTVVSYYAVFRKIIKAPVEISWTKTTETATTTIDVALYKATGFRVVSAVHEDGDTKSFTCTIDSESSTNDKAILSLSAGADVVDGDVFIITLATDNGGEVQIKVNIVSKITVTFELPRRGRGYYKAEQTNSGNVATYNSATAGEDRSVTLSNVNQFYQTMTAYPAEGYRIYRWVLTDKNGNTTYPSFDRPYVVQDGDHISVEFLPTGIAQFTVKDDPAQKLFYELDGENGAFAYAATIGKNVVVVHTSGTLYNEYKTPNAEGKYEFNIPSGYTLLVPGEATYLMCKNGLPEDGGFLGGLLGGTIKNYVVNTNEKSTKCNSYLTLLPNTRIIAEGDICVFSKMSYKQRYNGLPSSYGEIKMGASTEIVMKGGSQLTCYGYISGDPANSQVVAETNSTIYEAFQMRDWRGGTAASNMNKNKQWVFPVGQYYVQNIETKLILNHGAEEYVSTVMMMSDAYFPMNVPFIMKDNNSKADKGFICLGTGAQIVKWYDYTKDRQMYRVEGVENGATAKFGKIVLDVSVTVESNDYVLPITNNLDVTLDNIQVTCLYDMALLADAKLHIEDDATAILNGEMFVYDKEQQHKEYFYPCDDIIQPILYTAHHDNAPGIRSDETIVDAEFVVDGQLIVKKSDDALHGTGLYTTYMSENGTSSNEADYGANITSNGGGVIDFQVLGSDQVTYQYNQDAAQYISLPVTNARLRNEDGTYAAGDTMKVVNKYLYYKPNTETKGKWLVPMFGIPNAANNSNVFNITLPESKTQDVVCNITTAGVQNVSLANFTNITLQSDSRFAYTANSATYNKIDDEHGQLTIPLTYDAQNIHNVDAPYTEEITISYTYLHPIENVTKSESAKITLTAIEDYTPKFQVSIDNVDVTVIKTHKFDDTSVGETTTSQVVITPDDNTVAKLSTTEWSAVAASEPTFTAQMGEVANLLKEATVSYFPQVQSDADAGTLTITATYIDATSKPIPYSILINLNGVANKKANSLAFRDDLSSTSIYQGQTISDIFRDLGNIDESIKFEYKYYPENSDASALVIVEKDGGNYKLTAREPNNPAITEVRKVKIVATQDETVAMMDAKREVIVDIYPPVIWNWSNLYFGGNYDSPVVVSNTTTPWTLTKIPDSDVNNLVQLSGNSTNYTAVIGNGDENQVYQVSFEFEQGSYTKELISNIYADPRVLGYCVDYTRQFKGISTGNTTITFDEATRKAIFKENNTWEFNMIGMPDKLSFIASGDNTWYIGERANESTNYSDVVVWSKLSGEQTIQLKPTTNQVIIQYGEGSGNDGSIANLCISELGISANQKAVYFPINKDGSESFRTIVLTHRESTTPDITLDPKFTTTFVTSDKLGTPEEPYYQTEVSITDGEAGDENRVVIKGEYQLIATTQGGLRINVPIYVDEFPQGLPIKLATDNIKRYHFLVTKTDKVVWDEASRSVVFQSPTGNQTIRSVTFAFEGAPSRVSFKASQDIVDNEWTIYESEDGSDDSFQISGLNNRNTGAGGAFIHNLKYTTRYLRIVYTSENKSEVALSNFVIEGDPMLLVNPEELEFSDTDRKKNLTLKAINLSKIRIELDNTIDFQMKHGTAVCADKYELTSDEYPEALGLNKVGDIVLNTEWISNSIVNDGIITIYNVDDNDAVLAKVKLVGAGKYLHKDGAKETGLYTGIPDGTRDTDGDGSPNAGHKFTFHGADYDEYQYRPVDLSNAFADDGTALFDFLFVYGETTTTDATKNISVPSGENGSNARTPYYVYVRDVDAYGRYDRYRFVQMIDNANNVGNKVLIPSITSTDSEGYSNFIDIDAGQSVNVYITGFCPYANTGFTKYDEGVWYFRGKHGAKLDVYLEDCYIFSRNKTKNGKPFYARGHEENPVFNEDYARGSGGVLVFECVDASNDVAYISPFDVRIHTIGENLLKSNYGCFYYFFGMDPFQISAPIHVRMHSAEHVRKSKTSLTFDDIWPIAIDDATRKITATKRTNGFLGLQKMNNNAPSIDLGNPNTIVNFDGGQVELQNAQIVSTNYKTTLAISYRSGEYGGDNVGIKFAYGIGTDSVGGEVNFNDGTITVMPMWVKEEYKQYYLIDKDADGNEITRPNGGKTEYRTTCLRCPKNTEVYGGSVCWLRACQHVTSKGGAPMFAGKYLGQYIYDLDEMEGSIDEKKLATGIVFPDGIKDENGYELSMFYENNAYHPKHVYGLESVSPDADNKLYFWIPEGFGGVSAEKDKLISTWKACMTRIEAGYQGETGGVGGDTPVEPNEEIKYMLYCKIDDNIRDVIYAGTGEGDERVFDYEAPVKVPNVGQGLLGKYTTIKPTLVGDANEHQILSDLPYTITDKVYYVTTATADVWQSFTAPFDVAKIWVVETYDEKTLKKTPKKKDSHGNELTKHKSIMLEQAKHNADFAAFFGVAMAIGSTDPFETIFDDWKYWGMLKDKETMINGTPLYSGEISGYKLRGRAELIPYLGNNWETAHFYLNHNKGNWELDAEADTFKVKWDMLTQADLDDGILLHQGETYSMLFPYCTGCWNDEAERPSDFWDYWSGKILIFESTKPETDKVHTIQGSNYIAESKVEEQLWIFDGQTSGTDAILTGNSTFAMMNTSRNDVYTYSADPTMEGFMLYDPEESGAAEISPTTSFLYANVPTNIHGMPAKKVTREGKIIYGNGNNGNGDGGVTTGGHTPTVGGGNDLFITAISGGINVAVAAPQQVRVISSTGAVLYNGWVATSVDVALPIDGIYIVSGENEVQKILY